MVEQKLYRVPAGWLKSAVDALHGAGVTVVAPVETAPGSVDLAAVTSGDAVVTDYGNVTVPLKRLFFPMTEPLLEYEKIEGKDVDVRPEPLPSSSDEMVAFGCRPCDAAAVGVIDKVFQWDYDDVRYSARRERTTLVTFACTKPQAECFCTSVGGSPHGTDGSDVVAFLDADGGALLQVHTAKGQKLIERLGDAVRDAGEASPPDPPELKPRFDPHKAKQWIDANFESDFWAEESLTCLGCGACLFLCPTCHCFDIVDEGTWNCGQRRRNWDCCSEALFTLHASGHNPRSGQPARFRQKIMHKFKYFPERFETLACVGCGRCVRACGVGQNLPATLSRIEAM